MTTDTDKASDKLVEMALKSGAVNHFVQGLPDRYAFSLSELTAFRAAIIADLCGDVEPVAYTWWDVAGARHLDFRAPKGLSRARSTGVDGLVPASTVAALKAEIEALRKDAERYRWLRDGEIVADYPYPVMRMGGSRVDDQTIWADELDAAIDAALTKGQP